MKFRKISTFILVIVSVFDMGGREKTVSTKIERFKSEITKTITYAANQSEDTEDPDDVFDRAIDGYKNEFKEYLDITALNVQDKEAVNLPNFDINYISPEYYDVMHDYQVKLEASLTASQLEKYEELRKKDYNFDRYVTMNDVKYSTLEPSLKYDHAVIPFDPTLPITPVHPSINTNTPTTRAVAATTAGIIAILTNAGLGEAVIAAFTACISTMTTGLSTSWIPFVGWALAVALVAGALIALTVIIVKNWDKIKTVINDIKTWFLEEFSKFVSFIESFFADAVAQGDESTVAERQKIGDRELVWRDIAASKELVISIASKRKRNKTDVLLMKNLVTRKGTNEMDFWLDDGCVTEKFVVDNQLYSNYFISTYTWYNNTAKRMLYNGANAYSNYGGYGYKNLIYDRFDEMKYAVWGWNHYHLGMYNPVTKTAGRYRKETSPSGKITPSIRDVHAFFGLTYIRKEDKSGFDHYPDL